MVKVIQVVTARPFAPTDDDAEAYRIVGMVDDTGFFAVLEKREAGSTEWIADDSVNQYQVWESDSPDFMEPRDLLTDENAKLWFSYQGFEID